MHPGDILGAPHSPPLAHFPGVIGRTSPWLSGDYFSYSWHCVGLPWPGALGSPHPNQESADFLDLHLGPHVFCLPFSIYR